MNVVPLVSYRTNIACWPSTFLIDGACASNSGKYIDISNTKLACNDRIFNDGLPVRLKCTLSGAVMFDADIVFKDQLIKLGDLSEMFRTFPLAKNSYWTFELMTVSSFNSWIRVQFSLVDVDNEAAYLEEPCKSIADSIIKVDAASGHAIVDANEFIASALEHEKTMKEAIRKKKENKI
jgi:hypothetical protein